VRDFGARGDGVTRDTAAIQRAIDDQARGGGGIVIVPPGRYLSGTIHLRSLITLELQNGAILFGSPDKADYDPYEKLPAPILEDVETSYFRHALVTGEDLEYVAITGQGVIDGNHYDRGGPKTLALKNCRHISIRGITVRNSANYSLSFLGCEFVDVDGVTVLNSQADGIDPDNCRFVRIANCHVESRDDAICLKASTVLGRPAVTEGVTVTNCVIRTKAASFKLGTESAGTFRNIVFSNSVILPRQDGRRSNSGFEISMVDGGVIEDVAISNISVQGAAAPFFIRLGNRGRGQAIPKPGLLQGILVDNLVARGAQLAASITGLSGTPVRDVMLQNILIEAEGGRSEVPSAVVPEMPDAYPKAWMFGHLPAFGLFVRHVDGLKMHNVKIKSHAADRRPALLFDDVLGQSMIGVETPSGPVAAPER
jgi:polygalacturonase